MSNRGSQSVTNRMRPKVYLLYRFWASLSRERSCYTSGGLANSQWKSIACQNGFENVPEGGAKQRQFRKKYLQLARLLLVIGLALMWFSTERR